MKKLTDLPAWERLFKRIVWSQLAGTEGKTVLDFGSGEGITADHFAENNNVTAVDGDKITAEPSTTMITHRSSGMLLHWHSFRIIVSTL